jgi:tetratricopeptide (TPR) repeat protein
LSSFLVAASWLLAPLAHAQTDDERAHTHFTAGRSYFEEGNYEQALDEFNHAYDLSHRDVLLVNIANCQERLGQWRDAAGTLDRYLASLAPDAEDRGPMERRVAALRQRADQHDAEEAARLAAASHGDGSEATTSGSETSPPVTARPASDGLLVPAIVAFGVGGAAAIAWAVLGGLALGAQSSVQAGCGATHSCTPAEVADMNNFAVGADVSMSIALVAIAAGAVMLIVDPPHGEQQTTARLMPWGGRDGGGLVLGGTF